MAKIQIKNSFITSSADITISSSMVKFSSGISAKNITGSFSGSIPALTSYYKQGGNSFGTTAILGTNDNQALTFETNASEKVRIATDGNVGIGTTIVAATFHVVGQSFLNNVVANTAKNQLTINVNGSNYAQFYDIGVSATNALAIGGSTGITAVPSAPIMTWALSSGNVGIGTSSPAYKLDVIGPGTSNGVTLRLSDAASLANSRHILLTRGSVSGSIGIAGSQTEDPLWISRSSGYDLMVASSGNIGIGTSIPSQLLELKKTSASVIALLNYNDSVKFNINASSGGAGYIGMVSNHPLIFVNNDTERVRIDTSGNVGIGTSSPADKLHVIGNVRINGGDILNWSGQAFIQTLGNYDMFFRPNSTLQMILTGNGNIGIGSGFTNPLAKLHVSGSSTALGGLFNGRLFVGTTTGVGQDFVSVKFNSGGTYSQAINIVDSNSSASGAAYLVLRKSDDTYIGNIRRSSTDNAIYVGGNSYLALGSGDTERVRIDSSGNVGIGTTTPGYKLDVNGTIGLSGSPFASYSSNYNRIFEPAGNVAIYLGNATDPGNYYDNTTHNFRSRAGGTNYVIINSSGNVGIGTSSPGHLLSIYGTPVLDGALNVIQKISSNASYLTAPTSGIGFGANWASGGNNAVLSGIAGGKENTNNSDFAGVLIFYTRPNGGNHTEHMRITSVGNVGIGTTTVDAKLRVLGNVRATSFTGSFSGSVVGSNMFVQGGNSFGTTAILGTSDNQALILETNNTEKVRITTGGNVGIGTTTTGGLLSLHGTYPQLVANNPTTGSGVVIQLRDNGRDAGFMGHSTTTSRLQFGSKGSSAAHMTISETGDVGIGTTSPTAQANYRFLQVNGTNSAIIETMVGGTRIGGFDSSATALYVGSIGSYPIVFRTAVNEKMRLDTNGNLGIGTSSPATLLHVDTSGADARIRVSAGTNTVQGGMIANSGTSLIYAGSITNHGFSLRTNDTDRVRIDTSGNVGIGTTSVPTKLTTYVGSGAISGTNDAIRLQVSSYNDAARNTIVWAQDSGNIVLARYGTEWNNSTNQMNFVWRDMYNAGAGSTELMRLTGGGNLGIGSTNPTSAASFNKVVEVYDATSLSYQVNSGGTYKAEFGISSAGGWLGTSTTHDMRLVSNGTERMRILSGGNVGIGSSSPAYKLDVYDGNQDVARFYNNQTSFGLILGSTANTLFTNLLWTTSTGNAQFFKNRSSTSWGGADSFNFYTSNGGFAWHPAGVTNAMYLTTSGNLGIGTTSPATILQVVGTGVGAVGTVNIKGASVHLGLTSAAGSFKGWYGYFNTTTHGSDNDLNIKTGYAGTSNIRFSADGDTTAAMLYIKSDGNVGIGTTSPATKFEMYGGNMVLKMTGVTTGSIQFKNSSGTKIQEIRYDDSDGSMTLGGVGSYPIKFITSTTEKVRIAGDGNVGIGSSSPAYKLDINGTGRFTGDLTTNGNIVITRAGAYLYINGTNSDAEIVWQTNGSHRWAMGMNVGDATENFNIYNYTTATTNFTILKANGNVGIGSTAPNDKLDVVGRVYAYRYIAVSSNASLPAYATDTSTGMFNAATNQIGFTINGSERLRIDTNGNLGIGTTSPSRQLELYGNNSDAYIQLTRTSTAYQSTLGFKTGATDDWLIRTGDNSTSNLLFYSYGTSTYVMTILRASGNVGIGTTSPGTLLQVHGSNPFVRINNTITGDHGIKISYNNSDTHGLHLLYNANSALSFIDNTYPTSSGQVYGDIYFRQNVAGTMTTRMTIKADGGGNVGIGTTAPGYKLDVNGPIGVGGFRFIDQSTHYFRIFEPAGNIALYLGNASDPANYYDNTTHYFRNRGGSSNYVIINSSGNLGIGTSTVGAPLTIYKASNPWMRINGGGAFSYIQLDDGTSYGYLLKNTSSDTSNNALAGALYTYTDSGKAFQHIHSGTPLFTILSGGSVGIGTTSPNTKLQVSGSVSIGGYNAVYSGTGVNSLNITAPLYPILSLYYGTTLAGFVGGYSDHMSIYAPASKYISFEPGDSEKVRITAAGNVGIGTSSPATKLDVSGTSTLSGNVGVGGNITFSNDTTAYYIKGPANGGAIRIRSNSGADVDRNVQIGNVNNLGAWTSFVTFDSVGNVGIGTTSPSSKLHITGSGQTIMRLDSSTTTSVSQFQIKAASDAVLIMGQVGGSGAGNNFGVSAAGQSYIGTTTLGTVHPTSLVIGNVSSIPIVFSTTNTERMRILSGGNVGIGTSSPDTKLHVRGYQVYLYNDLDTNNTYFYARNSGAGNAGIKMKNVDGEWTIIANDRLRFIDDDASLERLSILSDGNVGIGTTAPISKLNTYASGSNLSVFKVDGGNGTLFEVTDQLSGSLFSVNDVSGLPLLEVFSNNRIVAGKYNTNALVISGSSVGIGTATPAYKLQVNGSFGATTKSFVIDHPTKQGKKLVYGSLESPYHGIRLTGRNVLIDGECKVQLPDYIYKLARSESVNIQITPIKCGKVIYVDEISVPNNYFVVKYDKSMFESYKNYEFFWDFTATRNDVDELTVEQ